MTPLRSQSQSAVLDPYSGGGDLTKASVKPARICCAEPCCACKDCAPCMATISKYRPKRHMALALLSQRILFRQPSNPPCQIVNHPPRSSSAPSASRLLTRRRGHTFSRTSWQYERRSNPDQLAAVAAMLSSAGRSRRQVPPSGVARARCVCGGWGVGVVSATRRFSGSRTRWLVASQRHGAARERRVWPVG